MTLSGWPLPMMPINGMTSAAALGLQPGGVYEIKVFHAERFDFQICRKPAVRMDRATGVQVLTYRYEKPFPARVFDPVLQPPIDLAAWSRAAMATQLEPSVPELGLESLEVQFPAMRGQRIVINGQQVRIDTSGMDIPATKPAYTSLVPTRDGRIMVLPSAEMTVAEECLDPNLTSDDLSVMDCSSGTRYADMFDPDGSFLGSFEIPRGVSFGWGAYIDGDEVWAIMQDEYGAVMVKRYRLVTPEDPNDS